MGWNPAVTERRILLKFPQLSRSVALLRYKSCMLVVIVLRPYYSFYPPVRLRAGSKSLPGR